MPTSVHQRLVDAITTRFQSILTSGGYNTNLGSNVFKWRDTKNSPFQSHELPALNLRDLKIETDPRPSRVQEHRMTVAADALTSNSATIDTAVRQMASDIKTAIGVDRYWTVTGTQLAFNTEPLDEEMSVEHDGNVAGGVRVRFVVHYRTASFAPYTLV